MNRTEKYDKIFGRIHIKNELETQADKKDLKGKFCSKPFDSLEITPEGAVHTCCVAHMPYSIGNIHNQSLEDIWTGERARLIRESIMDGSYRYCMHTICPQIIHHEQNLRPTTKSDFLSPVNLPTRVMINLDNTCNLTCPSCRADKRDHNTNTHKQEKIKQGLNNIISYVLPYPSDNRVTLSMTGAGDPFYSIVCREFLFGFDTSSWPNLKLNIITHGVMFTEKYWDKMHRWHDKISSIQITVDASTEDTYNKLRPGGNWNSLIENIQMLGEKIIKYPGIRLELNFIVQHGNFREMPGFIELINALIPSGNVHLVFNKIMDWNTYSYDLYKQQAVWRSDHPDYAEYISIINFVKEKKVTDTQWAKYVSTNRGDIF